MRRLLLAIVLTLTSLVGVSVAAPENAQATLSQQTYEDRVQYWVNQKRVNHDRVRVRYHACTDKYSERWAYYLSTSGRFYHRDLTPFFTDCGAEWAGEVLARGNITPREAVRLWMHSDAHRRVMLRPWARRIGVGARQDSLGRWVVVVNLTRF